MDVTKSNFDFVEKKIQDLLSSCLFVSIDLEFTGLRAESNGRNAPNRNDLPSQFYMKSRQMIDNFLMIQVGICLWNKTNESSSKLTAHPFNFWTFPQFDTKSTFLCQSSSLIFLRQHGFDFNKLIDDGINFLSIEEEQKERKYHQMYEAKKQMRVNERKENKTIVEPRTDKDVAFMKEIETKIQQFTTTTDDQKILELGAVNRFRRLLIYQLIDQKYSDCLIAFKQNSNTNDNVNLNSFLKNIALKKVTTHSKTNVETQQKKQTEQDWNDKITQCVGVRRIFDMISSHKVPVILHNGFLDVMHLYRSFIGTLPLDPCVFTEKLHHHLPLMFDTRYMMYYLFPQSKIIQNYSLSDCFHYFTQPVHDVSDSKDDNEQVSHNIALDIAVCIETNQKRDTQKEQSFLLSKNGSFHEAGYDAFCTGYVFAKIGAYLASLNNTKCNDLSDLYGVKEELHSNNVAEMVTLAHYVNRLNLSTFCKHFYVGDQYRTDNQFILSERMRTEMERNEERDDNKNEINYDGVLCGVDYYAIHDDWYKMFHCSSKHPMEDMEKQIRQFLSAYIVGANRISIYKRGFPIPEFAVLRIANITESEYEDIMKSVSDAPVEFMKYVDYKSNELRKAYGYIYNVRGNKQRVQSLEHHEANNVKDAFAQPPTKKQRVECRGTT
eukprot:105097_1